MSTSCLSLPDDWLALAWCLVTMAVCFVLIQVAASIRPRPTSRYVAPAKRTTGDLRAISPEVHRSTEIRTVAAFVAAYRLRLGNGHIPMHGMRRRPRFNR